MRIARARVALEQSGGDVPALQGAIRTEFMLKLERLLGENWRRPKGMHHATRERLLAAIWQCEERRDHALVLALARLRRMV